MIPRSLPPEGILETRKLRKWKAFFLAGTFFCLPPREVHREEKDRVTGIRGRRGIRCMSEGCFTFPITRNTRLLARVLKGLRFPSLYLFLYLSLLLLSLSLSFFSLSLCEDPRRFLVRRELFTHAHANMYVHRRKVSSVDIEKSG